MLGRDSFHLSLWDSSHWAVAIQVHMFAVRLVVLCLPSHFKPLELRLSIPGRDD